MRKGGLEPPRDFSHYHLKVARIPIPPLPQVASSLESTNSAEIRTSKFIA